jgi:hypothetical protein
LIVSSSLSSSFEGAFVMAKKLTPEQEALNKLFFPNFPSEKHIAEFYETLGRAISAWQSVEEALYMLYERCIDPRRPGAAGASFHSIQTFNIKLSATDAAVQFALLDASQEDRDEWECLRSALNKKAERRNHFAHFQVLTFVDQKAVGKKIMLMPQGYDHRYKVGIREKQAYSMSDIINITSSFLGLTKSLHRFRQKIPPTQTPAETSQKQ